jgi:O-antigen/teichoic acid export membrane protein
MGSVRLATQVVGVASLLSVLAWKPDIGGYFIGVLVANGLQLALALTTSAWLWRRTLGMPLFGRGADRVVPQFRREIRSLLAGGFFGFSKLIHRGSDLLLVAAFASDAQTGLYRLARSMTDGLYLVYDAANQVRLPASLVLLREGRSSEFGRMVRGTLLAALGATVGLVLSSVVVLPAVIRAVVPEYEGAAPVMALLAVPFFFVAGVHLWLWPLLLSARRLGDFAARSLLAAAIQVLAFLALAELWRPSAIAGAISYVAYYVALYPPILVRERAMLVANRTPP